MNISRQEFNEFLEDYNKEITELTKEIALNRSHIDKLLSIVEAHQEVLKAMREKISRLF